jgi:2-keto-4-pentenoate hydratase
LFPELTDEVSSYRVQAENTSHSLAASRRLVGRKIGLTAKVVQQQLGVGSPDYRMLFPQRRSIIESIEVRAIPSGTRRC